MLYLDNAATSFPKPPQVRREVLKCLEKYCGNPGRSSHVLAAMAGDKIYECRELAGKLAGVRAENVIITMNTTYALNFAVKSRIRDKDHVLISDLEHNSVVRPIANLARQGRITYDVFKVCDSTEGTLNDIKSRLLPNTRMIVATHKSNVTGDVLPISEIGTLCLNRGIIFVVDAAQSAGSLPIDVCKLNADIVCFPAHKGLYGVQGCAFMAVSNSMIGGDTLIEGGSGVNSLDPYMPTDYPERFEGGTLPTPAVAGTLEGLKWVNKTGIKQIAQREEELSQRLGEELSRDSGVELYSARGGIVLFNLKRTHAAEVGQMLSDLGICVRCGYHCAPSAHKKLNVVESGAVRVSFGAFNTSADINKFLDGVARVKRYTTPIF